MKYAGQYIRVKNLGKYQHYRNRTPPWIKLHQETLEDYDFARLPDASKAHALCIMLLASRLENRVPADPDWIARKIGARSRVDLDVLLSSGFVEFADAERKHHASATLDECLQDACIEGEGEKSREEAEAERAGARAAAASGGTPVNPEDSYCEALGERFAAPPPTPPHAEPRGNPTAKRWHRAGIPLALALATIDGLLERRRKTGAKDRVSSLRYFDDAVHARWAEVQELQAPGQRSEVAPLEIQPRLSRLAAQLPTDLPDRRQVVDRILALDGDSEAVESALRDLDAEVYATLVAGFNGAAAAEVEAAVATADFGGRLDGEDLVAARERLRRQLVRQHVGLPALSLFSAAAEGAE
jgi:hypothetical protein